MAILATITFIILIIAIAKPLPISQLIKQQPLYKIKTQWTALAKELKLDENFETQNSSFFKKGLNPTISGIKDGFQINITLKKIVPFGPNSGILGTNTIQCSIKIKNTSFLDFNIQSKKKTNSKSIIITGDNEFDSKFKISSNNFNGLNQVLSPKIKKDILGVLNNENSSKCTFLLEIPRSFNENEILDFNGKSTLSFVGKEIPLTSYSGKNHIKDILSLLIRIAKKLEKMK